MTCNTGSNGSPTDCKCPSNVTPLSTLCTMKCGADYCEDGDTICRAGSPCRVECSGKAACNNAMTLDGRTATDVTLICDAEDACKEDLSLLCGTGACRLYCSHSKSCLSISSNSVVDGDATSFECIGNCPNLNVSPFQDPTEEPTASPVSSTTTLSPTPAPTEIPTALPTNVPTANPSQMPSAAPTSSPSLSPTNSPSLSPSSYPTNSPSANPTLAPTNIPTANPFQMPSFAPTNSPSRSPSAAPSLSPSATPSTNPTIMPSSEPTNEPTIEPTIEPIAQTHFPQLDTTLIPTVDESDHLEANLGHPTVTGLVEGEAGDGNAGR